MKAKKNQPATIRHSPDQERDRTPSAEPSGTPGQRYYSVTQVCRRLRIAPHILRYWEKQFDISLKRNSAGRRVISARQLEKLELIRHLIHHEGLTVRAVRQRLERSGSAPSASALTDEQLKTITLIQRELIALRTLLMSGGTTPARDSTDSGSN
ncbi:MAG: MerR family transcriptional regulator [candidate division WOR-3 bacterium]